MGRFYQRSVASGWRRRCAFAQRRRQISDDEPRARGAGAAGRMLSGAGHSRRGAARRRAVLGANYPGTMNGMTRSVQADAGSMAARRSRLIRAGVDSRFCALTGKERVVLSALSIAQCRADRGGWTWISAAGLGVLTGRDGGGQVDPARRAGAGAGRARRQRAGAAGERGGGQRDRELRPAACRSSRRDAAGGQWHRDGAGRAAADPPDGEGRWREPRLRQ